MVASGGKVASGTSRVVFTSRIDDEFKLFALLSSAVVMPNRALIMSSVSEGYTVVVTK
jgi:hypothetical protein